MSKDIFNMILNCPKLVLEHKSSYQINQSKLYGHFKFSKMFITKDSIVYELIKRFFKVLTGFLSRVCIFI